MKSNAHSQAIPRQAIADAQAKLLEIIESLRPYATPLTPQERRDLPKMGPKSLAFVEKAYEFAQSNPSLLPAYLDMGGFGVDYSDAHGLWALQNTATQLMELVGDTQMSAGSEAYQFALVIYSAAKTAAAQDVPGARAVYEELKRRFPHTRRRPDPDPAAPAEPEQD